MNPPQSDQMRNKCIDRVTYTTAAVIWDQVQTQKEKIIK